MLPQQVNDRFADAGTGGDIIDGKVRAFPPRFRQRRRRSSPQSLECGKGQPQLVPLQAVQGGIGLVQINGKPLNSPQKHLIGHLQRFQLVTLLGGDLISFCNK